jgi:uncharacterized membrane protein
METNKKMIWLNFAILLLPSIHLAFIWNTLPETVPTHYDIHGNPNDYGAKSELWLLNAILLFVGLGTTLLILYLNKIDPKKMGKNNPKILEKVTLVVSVLLCIIQLYILFIIQNQDWSSPKPILVLVALVFTFLGNLMNNVKPNYFVGIRTPWTLESEEVWRVTHHVGAKLWFWSGLILALLVLILPMEAGTFVFIAVTFVIAIIPIVHSYRIFKRLRNQ